MKVLELSQTNLALIFSHLPMEEFGNVALTCKQFHHVLHKELTSWLNTPIFKHNSQHLFKTRFFFIYKDIATTLLQKNYMSLQRLNLANARINDSTIMRIITTLIAYSKSLQNLTCINMQNNFISCSGAVSFCQVIPHFPKLFKIELQGNSGVSDKTRYLIERHLFLNTFQPHVAQILECNELKLCDDGLNCLAFTLEQTRKLHTIKLGGNQITHTSVPILKKILLKNEESVKEIFLQDNFLTHEGLLHLVPLFNTLKRLQYINLSNNYLCDQVCCS